MSRQEREEIVHLCDAIRATHGCEAEYLNYIVRVREPVMGQGQQEVFVQCFRLIGHPAAKRCYVWKQPEANGTKIVTVLELPPVDSAKSAVKFSLNGTAT